MFKNDDLYNMDNVQKSIVEKQLILDLAIKIDVLFELLIKHKIIDNLEIESCEQYVSSKPEYKILLEYLNKSKKQVENYQNNPEQYLKDLFGAKLNGNIK